jgi:hypothetical protein
MPKSTVEGLPSGQDSRTMDTTTQPAQEAPTPVIVDVEDAFCVESGRTLTIPVPVERTPSAQTPVSPVKRKPLIKSTDLIVPVEEDEPQFNMDPP